MQLVAYGAQDVYLTGSNPIPTFFSTTFYRHQNFALNINNDTENNNIEPTPILIQKPEIIIKYLRLEPDGGNNQCVISLELIEENGEYWQCNTCNKVVTWETAELWISQHKTCPYCRQSAGLDTKYVNSAEPPTDF